MNNEEIIKLIKHYGNVFYDMLALEIIETDPIYFPKHPKPESNKVIFSKESLALIATPESKRTKLICPISTQSLDLKDSEDAKKFQKLFAFVVNTVIESNKFNLGPEISETKAAIREIRSVIANNRRTPSFAELRDIINKVIKNDESGLKYSVLKTALLSTISKHQEFDIETLDRELDTECDEINEIIQSIYRIIETENSEAFQDKCIADLKMVIGRNGQSSILGDSTDSILDTEFYSILISEDFNIFDTIKNLTQPKFKDELVEDSGKKNNFNFLFKQDNRFSDDIEDDIGDLEDIKDIKDNTYYDILISNQKKEISSMEGLVYNCERYDLVEPLIVAQEHLKFLEMEAQTQKEQLKLEPKYKKEQVNIGSSHNSKKISTEQLRQQNDELLNAAASGDLNEIKNALDKGANINTINPKEHGRYNAIQLAILFGQVNVIRFMINNGADLYYSNNINEQNALTLANAHKHINDNYNEIANIIRQSLEQQHNKLQNKLF